MLSGSRVRVGTANRESAEALCAKLRAAGGSCLVQKRSEAGRWTTIRVLTLIRQKPDRSSALQRAPNLILSKNLLARVLQNYATEFSLLLASKRIVPVVDISRALSFPVATVVEPKRKPPTQAALLHS
jgi:hypothetical protein